MAAAAVPSHLTLFVISFEFRPVTFQSVQRQPACLVVHGRRSVLQTTDGRPATGLATNCLGPCSDRAKHRHASTYPATGRRSLSKVACDGLARRNCMNPCTACCCTRGSAADRPAVWRSENMATDMNRLGGRSSAVALSFCQPLPLARVMDHLAR